MKPARSLRSRMASAASCKPAIQPSVRASSARDIVGGQGQPHQLGQEGRGLIGGEAQVGRAQLGQLPTWHAAASAAAADRRGW